MGSMAQPKKEPEAVERHLDGRIKLVWLLPTFPLALLVLLLGIGALIILPFGEPAAIMPSINLGTFIILAIIAIEFVVIFPSWSMVKLRYDRFTYSFEPDGLVIRSGIFAREKIVLPYERIQEIRVERSLVEQMLSLSTLCIDTASQTANAGAKCSAVLPGITYTNRRTLVEDIIMSRIMHRRAGAGLEGLVIPHDYESEAFMLQELHTIHEMLEEKTASKEMKEEVEEKIAAIEKIIKKNQGEGLPEEVEAETGAAWEPEKNEEEPETTAAADKPKKGAVGKGSIIPGFAQSIKKKHR